MKKMIVKIGSALIFSIILYQGILMQKNYVIPNEIACIHAQCCVEQNEKTEYEEKKEIITTQVPKAPTSTQAASTSTPAASPEQKNESQSNCPICGCDWTQAECDNYEGSGNNWCETNPNDCNCPANCQEQKQHQADMERENKENENTGNDTNNNSEPEYETVEIEVTSYSPVTSKTEPKYCWKGIPCDKNEPIENAYVWSEDNPKYMSDKEYSNYIVEGESKSKYCSWSISNGHYDGTDCCEQRNTCWMKNGVEYFGDFEGQPEYTRCVKYCFANNSDLSKADLFYYGYGTDLYSNEFWNYVSGYRNTLIYDVNYTPLRITPAEKAALISKTKTMTKFEGVSEDDCHGKVVTPPVTICVPEPGPIHDTEIKSASSCEGDSVMTYKDSVTCNTSLTKGFYNISCDTKINTSFDINGDGKYNISTYPLYKGTGLNAKIVSNITKKCTGKFDYSSWNNAYETAYSKLIHSKRESAEWFMQANFVQELEDVVVAFNSWNANLVDESKVKMVFPSSIIDTGNGASSTVNLESRVINGGNTSKKYTSNELLSDKKSVVKNFESETVYTVEYYPPQVNLDLKNGKISKSNSNIINGGNKIYLSLDANVGTYPFEIVIDGLPNNKQIKNNNCLINVLGKDLKYRIIDVSNPFVNKDYPKGNNWYNSIYDYTKTIKSDTWSKNSLYTFNLSSDKIEEIQKSNSSDNNAYLGTCYKKDKDGITKEICDILEK